MKSDNPAGVPSPGTHLKNNNERKKNTGIFNGVN